MSQTKNLSRKLTMKQKYLTLSFAVGVISTPSILVFFGKPSRERSHHVFVRLVQNQCIHYFTFFQRPNNWLYIFNLESHCQMVSWYQELAGMAKYFSVSVQERSHPVAVEKESNVSSTGLNDRRD
jgi:hypothetical protein